MIRELALLLLIVISLQVLIRFTLYEGFTTIKRVDDRKEWEQLSDDQVLELMGIGFIGIYSSFIVDEKQDPDARQISSEIGAICVPMLNGDNKVYNNQSDIDAFKNKIKNKAAGNKHISLILDVIDSNRNDIFKFGKRFYKAQVNKDETAAQAVIEDIKALAKKCVSEIRRRMPNFPFNPDIKKGAPELFAETPKPTATECKKYFKCSSIYAA